MSRAHTVLLCILRVAAWSFAACFWADAGALLWDGCTSTQLHGRFLVLTFVVAFLFGAIGGGAILTHRVLRKKLSAPHPSPGFAKSVMVTLLSVVMIFGAIVSGSLFVALVERLAHGMPLFG